MKIHEKEICSSIFSDTSTFTTTLAPYKTDKNILKRQSRDTKIDQRGKELLDLCISNQ
jgi:beta-lactamase class D